MGNNESKNGSIVIWGTRALGKTAFYHYNDRKKIVCYIDNDARKWGKKLNGIEICSPEILKEIDVDVVLAMNYGVDEVRKQLYEKYGISSSALFKINEEMHSMENRSGSIEKLAGDTCIVVFSGGLGNQMFQYAFFRCLEKKGKSVLADLETYEHIGGMKFQLTDVFNKINLKICKKEQKRQIIETNVIEKNKKKKFVIYKEAVGYEEDRRKRADLSLLDVTGGIIFGIHQTYRFAAQIRETLLNDFTFDFACEEALVSLHNDIIYSNAVGVHVRRGDYILEQNHCIYGGICTEKYYDDAIHYIKEKVGGCTFYFFSNDIDWVKEHYNKDEYNAIFVETSMFEHYQDWYDMYLMSICKHNIIANSTFSWWGAWLNQNADKIVIAPERWIHMFDYEDIYPPEWIRINGEEQNEHA